MALPLGSLIGIGGAAAGAIPSLLKSGLERRMGAMAAGRGPSAARTMLQQQAAANARNALSVSASQPGGLGLLQGLRSMETMNRDAGQQAANARVQEQMAAMGAAKQAQDQRFAGFKQIGAGIAGAGAAYDAQQLAAQQQAAATNENALQRQHELDLAQLRPAAPATPAPVDPLEEMRRQRSIA